MESRGGEHEPRAREIIPSDGITILCSLVEVDSSDAEPPHRDIDLQSLSSGAEQDLEDEILEADMAKKLEAEMTEKSDEKLALATSSQLRVGDKSSVDVDGDMPGLQLVSTPRHGICCYLMVVYHPYHPPNVFPLR